MDPLQLKITVLTDCRIDQNVKLVITDKTADYFFLPEEKFCPEYCMIHSSRLKAVKSSDLLKTSDIVKQPDQFCKFHVFPGTLHPSGDLPCVFHHAVGMLDLQINLLILPVVFIQIFLEFLFCMCNINHSATPLLLFFVL